MLSESSSESVSSKVSDNSERWAAIERRQKEKEMEERARRSEYTKLKKGLTTQPANARALGQRYGRNSATLSTRPSLQKRRSVFGFGPEGLSKELLAQLGAPGEREQPGGKMNDDLGSSSSGDSCGSRRNGRTQGNQSKLDTAGQLQSLADRYGGGSQQLSQLPEQPSQSQTSSLATSSVSGSQGSTPQKSSKTSSIKPELSKVETSEPKEVHS